MKTRNSLSYALIGASLFTAVLSSGCTTALIGATAVTAVSSAIDRRTVGTQVEDRSIQLKASSEISKELGQGAHINVTVFNRQALLTGEAKDSTARVRAEKIASGIPNVRSIVNDIQIAGVSSMTARTNDTVITGKVKAAFIDSDDVSATAFKVTTEAGTVYLMGLATGREAGRAAEVASKVSGVKRVVKVVDVVSKDKLEKLNVQAKQ